MATVVNNNLRMIDLPVWEQLTFTPASTAAGTSIVDDNERYIYAMFSATSFWRYCTWSNAWTQLASPPGGTLAAGSCMQFTKMMGGQWPATSTGTVHGSVFALIANGTAPTWQRYDIATNAWTALSVTNVPAAWGTDGSLAYPSPLLNNYTGSYHSGVLQTITATASAAIGATSITVSALPTALPIGAILNFGTKASPKFACLSAAAAAAAVSITVQPLTVALTGTETALWYDHMYLAGNNATQIYRYTLSTNAWATTSANSGNPAITALPGAVAAGCALKWLPGATGYIDKLVVVRGGATSNIYTYDLVANTVATLTYHPSTETLTTGSCFGAVADTTGKPYRIMAHKDVSNRIFEYDLVNLRMVPKVNQYLLSQGVALVGDKASCLTSPEGIQYFYMLLSTSSSFVRTPLFFT